MYLEVFMVKPFRVPAIQQNDGCRDVIPRGIEFSSWTRTSLKKRFEVGPELKAILLESIAQCERGETISAEQLFEGMPSRE
jgi:hypothetical protein